MQKLIIDQSGHRVGIYYPITGKLVLANRNPLKLSKQAFEEYCLDMAWSVL